MVFLRLISLFLLFNLHCLEVVRFSQQIKLDLELVPVNDLIAFGSDNWHLGYCNLCQLWEHGIHSLLVVTKCLTDHLVEKSSPGLGLNLPFLVSRICLF